MVRAPAGVFDDGWVARDARFTFRAHGVISLISVEIWIPPGIDPFTLSLRVEDEPEITLRAHRDAVAVMQYPIYAVAFTELSLELVANNDRRLEPPDTRRGSYILRNISIT